MSTVAASEHQAFESAWWGDCVNTFGEESKQLAYAPRMGLVNAPQGGRWPVYDLAGKSVLDLGGGPVSMLLKTVNGGRLIVVDPCPYPDWVRARYVAHGIAQIVAQAEGWGPSGSDDLDHRDFDECWIYNCLQHVQSPERVIAAARACARTLRIFEWLETPPSVGHPHTLHCDDLNRWIGGGNSDLCRSCGFKISAPNFVPGQRCPECGAITASGTVNGKVELVNENGAEGLCYYGAFDL